MNHKEVKVRKAEDADYGEDCTVAQSVSLRLPLDRAGTWKTVQMDGLVSWMWSNRVFRRTTQQEVEMADTEWKPS
ncbi:uncharacterized protein N7479_001740 [Penicillium vulpinum]|uniref:uncharacterized protein n=1 Tax=Penicillium vulpinum TaxID=29845 RepID=UPI0025468222|nr:uncharacterized protein N7479_001740 [Penicillium vulpinum]KAJ5971822.1 hypothetical protein N7479_001740 [Penicillium vulpinum]